MEVEAGELTWVNTHVEYSSVEALFDWLNETMRREVSESIEEGSEPQSETQVEMEFSVSQLRGLCRAVMQLEEMQSASRKLCTLLQAELAELKEPQPFKDIMETPPWPAGFVS